MSKKISKELIAQYSERIPNFVELFTKASGLTVADFQKLLKSGKITETFFYEALGRLGK
jgi:tape measure domain-containing protein